MAGIGRVSVLSISYHVARARVVAALVVRCGRVRSGAHARATGRAGVPTATGDDVRRGANDEDGDGVTDACDPCPQFESMTAVEPDGDGEGDRCDLEEVTRRFGPGNYRVTAYSFDPPGLRWEILSRGSPALEMIAAGNG